MPDSPTTQPVCVVTGGSSGIGRATCSKFLSAGYRVAFCGRDQAKLTAVRNEFVEQASAEAVLALRVDVGVADQAAGFIQGVHEQFGRIDVLVNNAGTAPLATINEMSHEAFFRLLDVNVAAVFRTTKAVWPIMEAQGGGIIVNISSLAAIDPFDGLGTYGATKAWVEAFTNASAREGAATGIRSYCVRPGAIETQMLRSLFPDFPSHQSLPPTKVAELIHRICQPSHAERSGETFQIAK